MLTLQLNREVLDRVLTARGVNAKTLSEKLSVMRSPTYRTVTGWLDRMPVSPRWREAIAALLGSDQAELFDESGRFSRSALDRRAVNRGTLSGVLIKETVSQAAVSEWRNGGGIEPDMLLALAHFLAVAPRSLLASETVSLINMIMQPDFSATPQRP